jgi:glycolate oxidase subunit GlcD
VDQLIENLEGVVGRDAVLSHPDELLVYECDGLPHHKHLPRAVVFPDSTEETSEVMRVLADAGVAFTPRGAGTGLSGGALALNGAVVVELARMRRVLHIDEGNRLAVVQTGMVNAKVSKAVASLGLHYVPDPSSQPSCTIGGNLGENAGGVHCLKYGTTTDHVLAIRVVLAGGEVVDLGGITGDQPGYDLRGVFVGSEGTFGIATEATLRLVPTPPSVRTLLAEFPEVDQASHAVSAIIAAGLIPAGLEMMDQEIIRAVEASVFAAGLPPDAGAALLIELDGLAAGLDEDAERVKAICTQYGARNCRLARDENERKKLWAARKGAFGAVGRIAPDAMIQDAVVPRSRLPEIMADAYRVASKYQLKIANVFHAGDGNLHPLICFDSRSAAEVIRVKEAGRELMEICVRAGGSITGEHGVGLDKRDLLSLIFSEDDLETMLRVRSAFDPTGLINPGKIIPLLRGCGEARAVSSNGRMGEGASGRVGDAVQLTSDPRETLSSPIATPRTLSSVTVARSSETIANQIAAIIGDANVSFSSSAALPSHGTVSPNHPFTRTPSQHFTRSPNLPFAAPGSIDEAVAIMKLAAVNGWSVVPAGRGTWLDVGNSLRRADLILSTQRLNRLLEHTPADLVAVAEAGITLADLNQDLEQNGQWLPLDPVGGDVATVGGIVASGVSGAQRPGYGPPRGFVIGLKVVLADGRIIKAGGRVVKNVAGYDLCKLFTASYGTLGLIAEINFKLRPRPECEASVVASGSIATLIATGQSILRAPLFPVAVELVSPALALPGLDKAEQPLLMARFAGNQRAVKEQCNTAFSLLRQSSGISNVRVIEEDNQIWQQLVAKIAPDDSTVSWRASVPPAGLLPFIEVVSENANRNFCSLRWQAGIADGRIQFTDELQSEVEGITMISKLRDECQRLKGTLVIEQAPAAIKHQLGAWGDLGSSAFLMHRVKQQLDPEDIFSPGRFGF